MPVIRVREFFDERICCCLAKRVGLCDFLTSFPVVNVEGVWVVRVFKEHIHRPREFGWFVINHLFRAKWREMLVVCCEIEKVLVFGARVLVWCVIVVAFNVEMEASSRSRSGSAIIRPGLLDLLGSLAVILAAGPFWRADHIADDLVSIELLELGVIECGHGSVCGVAINRVFVCGFFELDVGIARMRVDEGEFERIVGSFCHNSLE